MAERTDPNTNSKSLEEQFKALQVTISKRDTRLNRMADGLLDIGELKASSARQEYMLLSLLEADPDRKQVAEEMRERIKTDTTSSAYIKEIEKLLTNSDKNWNDKDMMEARALWLGGNASGALAAVQGVVKTDVPVLTDEQIEAEVTKRLTEREAAAAAAKKVDPGSSTAGGDKKYTRDDAKNLHKTGDGGVLDHKTAKAAAGDFLDKFYSKG